MEGRVTNDEIQELKKQLETFGTGVNSKIDALGLSVNLVHNILAEQKGANIPMRIQGMESRVDKLKEEMDKRTEVPSQVKQNSEDIRTLFKFQYMSTGGLIFLQVVLTVLGKFAIDAIFKIPQQVPMP